uniref:C-type lectin domain-containing protein n=1 Tax=Kryptolebias marmoratus TaxID=37003 RepID=A0A3Q3EI00_KRYMA
MKELTFEREVLISFSSYLFLLLLIFCTFLTQTSTYSEKKTFADCCVLFLFTEQRSSKYILVETLQTWHDAKNYCRSKNTDLAKVRNTLENDEVYKMLEKASWIGLHRKLWSKWSDQSPATFTNWNKGQPDNTGSSKTSCAAVNTTTGMWWNVACDTEQEFICEKLILSKRRFKLRLQSETDLNDPTAQQQILEQVP